MGEYTIYPIKVGEFKAMEKSTMTCRDGFGIKLVGVPILIFLIKGAGRTILVLRRHGAWPKHAAPFGKTQIAD